MDCKRCKHNFVCKYKEDFKDVKMDFSIDEYKGVFDISCNEYLECVNDAISPFENMEYSKPEPRYRGFKVGDEIMYICEGEEYVGVIEDMDELSLYMKRDIWRRRVPYDKITGIKYRNC